MSDLPMQTMALTGQCLCGAVHFLLPPLPQDGSACRHGTRHSGNGDSFLNIDTDLGVTFTGENAITLYRSSERTERGFCNICGTLLFYRTLDHGFYAFPAGLFANVREMKFAIETFIDEQPTYYTFITATKQMNSKEVASVLQESAALRQKDPFMLERVEGKERDAPETLWVSPAQRAGVKVLFYREFKDA